MKQGTKRNKWYCKSCDKSMVSAGTKCKVCGTRADKKIDKFNPKQAIKDDKEELEIVKNEFNKIYDIINNNR